MLKEAINGFCMALADSVPGVSGSTLLLIFGAYIPVITAVKGIMAFNFKYIPAIMFFGFGVLFGAITVVKGIKICLEKFRTQALYSILGMMIGSFYAIIMGPTTLKIPKAPLGIENFSIIACGVGILLVVGMQMVKDINNKNAIKIVKNR